MVTWVVVQYQNYLGQGPELPVSLGLEEGEEAGEEFYAGLLDCLFFALPKAIQ